MVLPAQPRGSRAPLRGSRVRVAGREGTRAGAASLRDPDPQGERGAAAGTARAGALACPALYFEVQGERKNPFRALPAVEPFNLFRVKWELV